ncbi:hypothetical protein RRG08_054485 [Elysia crispata]|uniref:Uncharacterized protein n=1 Tax=Elysia crispata TaxID=231223 RepID=A0AAE0Y752_9GAST|nr:hypothetical protein RRG08_054485 [Elysia crispata]
MFWGLQFPEFSYLQMVSHGLSQRMGRRQVQGPEAIQLMLSTIPDSLVMAMGGIDVAASSRRILTGWDGARSKT